MKNKRIGRDEVIEKFGVPPEKVIDVQALAGDSIDNVPGVPGIGIKTAAELITTYGDLDTLLARAGEIKQPKRREKLIEFAEQARISRQLVTLKDDVPLEIAIETLGVQDPMPRHVELPQSDGIQYADEAHRRSPGCRGAATARRFGRRNAEATVTTGCEEHRHAGGTSTRGRDARGGGCTGAALVRAIVINRGNYETVTTRAQLDDWARRARQAAASRLIPRPRVSTPCTPAWLASPSQLLLAKPATCRWGTRALETICSAAPILVRRSSRPPKRSKSSARCSKTRPC